MDFFRFLFDFKRSNPFSQFANKDKLTEIKSQARLLMLQASASNSSPATRANSKRRFGSELTTAVRNDK
jgi:hypothetical protein